MIARAINVAKGFWYDSLDGDAAIGDTAKSIARQLKIENPAFDTHKFMNACGYEYTGAPLGEPGVD